MKPNILALAGLLILMIPAGLAAQTGKISGRVIGDHTQEPLSAATVIISVKGEARQSVRSNANGNFSFSNLEPGTYDLIVNKKGYNRFSKAVRVNPDFTLRLIIPVEGGEKPVSKGVLIASNSSKSVEVKQPGLTQIKPVADQIQGAEPGPSADTSSEYPGLQTIPEEVPADVLVDYPDTEPAPEGGLKAVIRNIEYPDQAIRMFIQGKVVVSVLVNSKGEPERVDVLTSAHPVLSEAAINTIYKTRFIAATQGGRAISARVNLPVQFVLR
ncbi:MAG: TonB family protein [Bacteroidetes bacterium]|nr:TonB family protein [Bacteroidota bacterium]